MLIDRKHRICVTGDIFINMHDQTKPQATYNALGPLWMTHVDTDIALCKEERTALFALLGGGRWQVLGGHGALFELNR